MKFADARREESWADSFYSTIGGTAPPSDLLAIARKQRISRVLLRPMIQRGALVPIKGGFDVYVRHLVARDLDPQTPEPREGLNAQQRFTLAHEIAHTRFYKISGGKPVQTDDAKTYAHMGEIELEEICDRSAKRLLVPTDLLRKEIKEKLGDNYERIDAAFVRAIVTRFDVSYEVAIERLRATDLENVFARCIVLARRRQNETKVMTWYMGMSLLSVLPGLTEYEPIRNWFPEFPEAALGHDRADTWRVERRGRQFDIQKFPLGRPGEFLLQIDDLAHKAPSSNFSWYC